MPVTLSSSIAVGDLDSQAYAEAKIVHFQMDIKNNKLSMVLEYGNTVEGEWVPGIKKESVVILRGDDYASFVSDNQTLYDNVKTALYNKAIALGVISGSVS